MARQSDTHYDTLRMAAASASISSAFITDAIADFKGRLDTLMEESLSKYREKAIVGIEDDYTPGYGAIASLAMASLHTTRLPIEIPPGKFSKDKGIWLIYSCSYAQVSYTRAHGYNHDSHSLDGPGSMSTVGPEGVAMDNYGNVYNYNPSMSPSSWQVSSIGTEPCRYPLPNVIINFIKTLPHWLGVEVIGAQFGSYQLHRYFLQSYIGPLAKLAAETIYKSRQAIQQLRKELDAERAKTAALDAELRALKDRSPPSEDLLGLTEEGPKAASGPLASAIMEL